MSESIDCREAIARLQDYLKQELTPELAGRDAGPSGPLPALLRATPGSSGAFSRCSRAGRAAAAVPTSFARGSLQRAPHRDGAGLTPVALPVAALAAGAVALLAWRRPEPDRPAARSRPGWSGPRCWWGRAGRAARCWPPFSSPAARSAGWRPRRPASTPRASAATRGRSRPTAAPRRSARCSDSTIRRSDSGSSPGAWPPPRPTPGPPPRRLEPHVAAAGCSWAAELARGHQRGHDRSPARLGAAAGALLVAATGAGAGRRAARCSRSERW